MDELKVEAEIKRGRVAEMMKEPVVRGFLWGLGSAVAASYLWPKVRGSVRPLLVGAVTEAMRLADGAMESAAHLKEDFEDLVAEAKLQKERGAESVVLDAAEGEASQEVAQLKDSVQQLQQRLSEMDQVRIEVAEIKRLLRQIAEQASQSERA